MHNEALDTAAKQLGFQSYRSAVLACTMDCDAPNTRMLERIAALAVSNIQITAMQQGFCAGWNYNFAKNGKGVPDVRFSEWFSERNKQPKEPTPDKEGESAGESNSVQSEPDELMIGSGLIEHILIVHIEISLASLGAVEDESPDENVPQPDAKPIQPNKPLRFELPPAEPLPDPPYSNLLEPPEQQNMEQPQSKPTLQPDTSMPMAEFILGKQSSDDYDDLPF